MAAPIIDSVAFAPATVQPGQSTVLTVLAHDPDTQTVLVQGTVQDSQGNVQPFNGALDVGDPLTYAITSVLPVGWTVTQRANQPGVFDIVTA